MNNYFLYLAPSENNKIKFFYLSDKQKELIYFGNVKISDCTDSLRKINDYIRDDINFLIIPLNEEKFNVFSDMGFYHLKEMNYKNFLKTYDLYEWII